MQTGRIFQSQHGCKKRNQFVCGGGVWGGKREHKMHLNRFHGTPVFMLSLPFSRFCSGFLSKETWLSFPSLTNHSALRRTSRWSFLWDSCHLFTQDRPPPPYLLWVSKQHLRDSGRGARSCKDWGSALPKHSHLFSGEKHFVPARTEMDYTRVVQALPPWKGNPSFGLSFWEMHSEPLFRV